VQAFDNHVNPLKDNAWVIAQLLAVMQLFIKWCTFLGSRSEPVVAFLPVAITELRTEITYLRTHGIKKPEAAAAPAGGGAGGGAAAGGAGAVAAPAPVPVGGRVGLAAEKQQVKAIARALLASFNNRFDADWEDVPTLNIASVLDVRTALSNGGEKFENAMTQLESSDLVTAAERAAPAAAAPPVPAGEVNPFAPAAGLGGPVSPFREEVRRWATFLGKLVPAAARSMNPLVALKQFRDEGNVIIPRCARTILAVPVQSVESERLFSLAGLIVHRFRTRLAPETAEAQVLLSSWLRREEAIALIVPEMRAAQGDDVAFLELLTGAIEGIDAEPEAPEDGNDDDGEGADSEADEADSDSDGNDV